MDEFDKTTYRLFRNWFIGLVVLLLLIGGGASIISRVFNLYWFPWEIKMQTGMIRNSNSYITTQQTALRQFRGAYETAETDGQRAAIIQQMHEIADLIPDNVQPDIQIWLATHS